MIFTQSSRWKRLGPFQGIIGRISGILDKNLTNVKVGLVSGEGLEWHGWAKIGDWEPAK
jgi:hypothetical protein